MILCMAFCSNTLAIKDIFLLSILKYQSNQFWKIVWIRALWKGVNIIVWNDLQTGNFLLVFYAKKLPNHDKVAKYIEKSIRVFSTIISGIRQEMAIDQRFRSLSPCIKITYIHTCSVPSHYSKTSKSSALQNTLRFFWKSNEKLNNE